MKTTLFFSFAALLRAVAVRAQPTAALAASASATSTSAASSCTASLITKLCDYKEPGPEFAVASSGRTHCWEYCDSHTPCKFVIFVAGNPNTGTGTCWLYPGEDFDPSLGKTGCGNPVFEVYDQPVCDDDSATPTSGACAATATPSAVASVCGYPAPKDCFNDCSASGGASDCLSQCAKADSCNFVVFNPQNDSNSPYASGSCWMYAEGKYDPKLATTCDGAPEQFVYKNLCPKPKPKPSSTTAKSSSHSSSTTTSPDEDATADSDAASAKTTSSKDAAPTGLSRSNLLAIGMAILMF